MRQYLIKDVFSYKFLSSLDKDSYLIDSDLDNVIIFDTKDQAKNFLDYLVKNDLYCNTAYDNTPESLIIVSINEEE